MKRLTPEREQEIELIRQHYTKDKLIDVHSESQTTKDFKILFAEIDALRAELIDIQQDHSQREVYLKVAEKERDQLKSENEKLKERKSEK